MISALTVRHAAILSLGWLVGMAGVILTWWSWNVGGSLAEFRHQLLAAWILQPELHRGTVHAAIDFPHPLLGGLGLVLTLVAMALSFWFAAREGRAGRLA